MKKGIILTSIFILTFVFVGCKTTEKSVKQKENTIIKKNIIAHEVKADKEKTLQQKKIKKSDIPCFAEVTGDNVRIRSCPEVSTNCLTLGYVNKNDVVQVLDKGGVPYKGKLWFKVKLADGTVGWMYEEYARKSDNKIIVKKVLDRPVKQEEITGFKQLMTAGQKMIVFYDTTNMRNLHPKAKANESKTNLIFYDEEGKIKKKVSLRCKQTWEGKVYSSASKVVLSKNNNYILFGYDKVRVYSITGKYIGSVDTSAYADYIEIGESILSDNPEGIFVPISYVYLYIGNAKQGTFKQIDISGTPHYLDTVVRSDISDDGEYIVSEIGNNILGLYTKEGKEIWKTKSTNGYRIPAISSKGHYVAIPSGRKALLYDRSGKLIKSYNYSGEFFFSPDEKYLAMGMWSVSMQRTSDGAFLWRYVFEDEGGYAISGKFIENGKYFIIPSIKKKTGFYIFDSTKGKIGYIDFGVGEINSSMNDFFYYSHKKLYFIVKGQLKVYELSDIIDK